MLYYFFLAEETASEKKCLGATELDFDFYREDLVSEKLFGHFPKKTSYFFYKVKAVRICDRKKSATIFLEKTGNEVDKKYRNKKAIYFTMINGRIVVLRKTLKFGPGTKTRRAVRFARCFR
jgi:hypothetical protein